MGLFAEKCIRCGTKTRGEYQGKPTCERCRDELELALAEKSEALRACPADGQPLRKEIVHGVIIDRCTKCSGVWLDPGELERVNQEVAEEVWRATTFARPLA